jgi:hypothetical protein
MMMMMMEKKICRFNYTGEQERESLALALSLSLIKTAAEGIQNCKN